MMNIQLNKVILLRCLITGGVTSTGRCSDSVVRKFNIKAFIFLESKEYLYFENQILRVDSPKNTDILGSILPMYKTLIQVSMVIH